MVAARCVQLLGCARRQTLPDPADGVRFSATTSQTRPDAAGMSDLPPPPAKPVLRLPNLSDLPPPPARPVLTLPAVSNPPPPPAKPVFTVPVRSADVSSPTPPALVSPKSVGKKTSAPIWIAVAIVAALIVFAANFSNSRPSKSNLTPTYHARQTAYEGTAQRDYGASTSRTYRPGPRYSPSPRYNTTPTYAAGRTGYEGLPPPRYGGVAIHG